MERTLARQHAGPDRRPPAPDVAPAVRAAVPEATTAQLLQRRLGDQNAAAFVSSQAPRKDKDEEQRVKTRESVGAPRASSLSISSPADPAEREAVSVASNVVRMPTPQSRPAAATPRLVSRSEVALAHMPPRADKPPVVEPKVASDIQGSMSGGAPLPAPVRTFMEPRFKADFSGVRVHTDDKAAALSSQVNARAFTVGQHVFFGKGAYQPDTTEGKELIAHELTHTIQQGAAVQRSEAPVVTQQSQPQVQRWGIGAALDYIADKANIIPGFRMLTIILGVNPINMSPVARSGANILRALIEFMPGGGLITQALDSSGVFEKAGGWIEQQIKTLGMAGSAIKQSLMTFLDSLGWRDVLDPWDVWTRAKRLFTDPVDRLIAFAKNAVSTIIQFIKDAILLPIANFASTTRGWDLLIAVLGKNPITGAPVPRTAETLIPGFLKLIGQEEVWENMKKSNSIARAWAWFQSALSGLMGFVSQLPTLFITAFKSLELIDIILPYKAFQKVVGVFGTFIINFVTWAGNALWTLLEIIFEAVSPAAWKYIKKTGAALKSILKNPLPFVRNLVKAAKLGFQNFADNFGGHLKAGLIDWLTGSLPGIYIPKAFELSEIVKFVFSVLGLTWQNVRQKLVKVLGEPVVKALEIGFDVVVTLVTKGPAAAWDKIQEHLTNLKDMVIGGIQDFVIDMIVKKAVPKLIAMFIPGAGFISAILSIYDTVMVFVNKISTIIQVVTGFIDSIVEIAGGGITTAANKVEGILARLLSLAINFLAGFLGLGKVADKIMGVFTKVRGVIDNALDKLIAWIVMMAKKLGSAVASKVKSAFNWAFANSTFKDGMGATHTVSISDDGQVTVNSTPQAAKAFVKAYIAENGDDKGIAKKINPLIDEATELAGDIAKVAKDKPVEEVPAPAKQKKLLALSMEISELLAELVAGDRDIGKTLEKYLLEGQVGTYATVPKPVGDQLTPDHQPQASVIQGAADYFKALGITGSELSARALDRAAAGYAINIHFNRHVAGATYGSKGKKKKDFTNELLATGVTSEKGAKKLAKEELGKLLEKDVLAMKEVVKKDVDDHEWRDLKIVKKVEERKKLKKSIQDRIVAGQNQIAKQPFDF